MKIFQVGTAAKMVRLTTDNDRLIIQVPLNRIVYSISGTVINFIITTNNRVITSNFNEIKRQNGSGFSNINELSLYLTDISSETSGGGSGGGITQQQLDDRVNVAESNINSTITQVNNSLTQEIATVSNQLSNKLDITKVETPVLTLSDLPTPNNGIIDLLPNVTYRFQGLVNIGNNQIRVSTSNTILGFDRSDDGIIYSGTTQAIIVNNNTLSVDTITIRLTNNNAKFFNIENSNGYSVIFKKCIFAGDSAKLGDVVGSNVFGINDCIVNPLVLGGLDITGDVNDVIISDNIFLNKNASKQIFLTNLNSEAIQINDNIFKTDGIGIDIDNITLNSERMGIITSNGFSGSGRYINGIYEDNIDWILESNSNVINTSAGYSPNNYLIIKDDFIVGGTETGEIGINNWTFSNGSMGNGVASSSGHPGVVQRISSTSSGQVCSFYIGRTPNSPVLAYADFHSLIWIIQLTGDITTYDFTCGLSSDWGTITPANGIFFRKIIAEPNWQMVSRVSNIETSITSTKVIDTNYIKLEIIRDFNNSIRFRINEDEVINDITTNLPNANTLFHFGNNIVARTSSSRTVNIDYFSAIIKTNNR